MSNSETLFAMMTVFTKGNSARNLQNREEIQRNSQPSPFTCSLHISHMLIQYRISLGVSRFVSQGFCRHWFKNSKLQ